MKCCLTLQSAGTYENSYFSGGVVEKPTEGQDFHFLKKFLIVNIQKVVISGVVMTCIFLDCTKFINVTER